MNNILNMFAYSCYDLIAVPAQKYLNGDKYSSCGCEFDLMYKKVFEIL